MTTRLSGSDVAAVDDDDDDCMDDMRDVVDVAIETFCWNRRFSDSVVVVVVVVVTTIGEKAKDGNVENDVTDGDTQNETIHRKCRCRRLMVKEPICAIFVRFHDCCLGWMDALTD